MTLSKKESCLLRSHLHGRMFQNWLKEEFTYGQQGWLRKCKFYLILWVNFHEETNKNCPFMSFSYPASVRWIVRVLSHPFLGWERAWGIAQALEVEGRQEFGNALLSRAVMPKPAGFRAFWKAWSWTMWCHHQWADRHLWNHHWANMK